MSMWQCYYKAPLAIAPLYVGVALSYWWHIKRCALQPRQIQIEY